MQLYEKNGRKIGHTGPFECATVEGKFFNLKMARPTGIEPVLRVPETLVISFSLRARAKFFIIGPSISQRALWRIALATRTISSWMRPFAANVSWP
jgi:hypothetical protein